MPDRLPSIQEEWEEFVEDAFVRHLTDEQKHGAMLVFYSGVVTMLSIALAITNSDHNDHAKILLFKRYHDEIKALRGGTLLASHGDPCD